MLFSAIEQHATIVLLQRQMYMKVTEQNEWVIDQWFSTGVPQNPRVLWTSAKGSATRQSSVKKIIITYSGKLHQNKPQKYYEPNA